MDYTVIINGKSYDLPKKTIQVVEKIDTILKVDSIKGMNLRDKFQKLHDFTCDLVGKENAEEILGGNSIDSIDLSEVTLAARKIIDAYDKPVADYEADKAKRRLNELPIERIISLANSAQRMGMK